MTGGAVISPCGLYRYHLWRQWGESDAWRLLFIMLNPSTADALDPDNTIRVCIRLAKLLGYHGIDVGNLFALRNKSPAALLTAADPVGPDNDVWLRLLIARSPAPVIVAWGTGGKVARLVPPRVERLQELFAEQQTQQRRKAAGLPVGWQVQCYGFNKDGSPKHPLYLPNDAHLTAWQEAA